MEVFGPDDLPVVFSIGRAEIRSGEAAGMAVSFYRLPAGADGRPLLEGMPGGSCHCPHWGYVIRGRLRIHTRDGAHEVPAGRAFHVEPGHAPEALEDTEMVEFSPVKESQEVDAYLQTLMVTVPDPSGGYESPSSSGSDGSAHHSRRPPS